MEIFLPARNRVEKITFTNMAAVNTIKGEFSLVFTRITTLEYVKSSGLEHIWSAATSTSVGYVAGAVPGMGIVRVRFVRGPVLDERRYQLTDKNQGTLPYHSWMVATGDEEWATAAGLEEEARGILEPYLHGFSLSEHALRLERPLAAEERVYALGERTGPMNKRGQVFPVWNVDPPMHHTTSTVSMYTSIPFYIGSNPGTGETYGVLVDYTGNIDIDMGKSDPNVASITLQGDQMVVYFFTGPRPADVLRQYTALTGHLSLPPRWTLGHHQSRWGYTSAPQLLEVASKMREREHPNDSVWLDIDYMHGYRNFTWNQETFPDPEVLVRELKSLHTHLVTIIDPGTKVDEKYHIYQEGLQKGYFCTYDDGKIYRGTVWPGICVFPDFSRAEVRQWWGDHYQELFTLGVDGIWNDMDEPTMTSFLHQGEAPEGVVLQGTMPDNVLHRAGGEQETGPDGPPINHPLFHNAYGMEMARATYESFLRLRPNERPFVLTRSGTAGMQRYAALWTGDNTSDWDHIMLGLRMCLNISMSGVAFVGVDIGGFWGSTNGELLVRSGQLGALLPFCRNHSAAGNDDQEPWSFGEPYESAYRKAIATRYQLLPYLYTLFHHSTQDGSPVIRPLYYHYPHDEQAFDTETEFLVGENLLSAPIGVQGTTSRSVYLPAGQWFDYWTGQEYPGGGETEIEAPLDRWPLFVKGNTILPTIPATQYVDERPSDPITFTCYMATDGLASYTLYEDDGSSQAYKNGAFALTSISCRVENNTITVRIDEQHQGYTPAREAYDVVVHAGSQVVQQRIQAGQGSVTVYLG